VRHGDRAAPAGIIGGVFEGRVAGPGAIFVEDGAPSGW